VPEQVDYEAAGLLDGLDGDAREARRELLDVLCADGASLDELKRAVAEDRLALLPVERVLAGEGKYTAAEVAERSGLDPDLQDRLFRALGLALADPEDRVYGDEDVEDARSVTRFLEAGFSEGTVLEVCRVLGDSMARLAATVGGVVGDTLVQPGDTERDLGLRYAQVTRELGPQLEPRRLPAARPRSRCASRTWSTSPGSARTSTRSSWGGWPGGSRTWRSR
jgi:adenylate cyclase